MKILKKYIYSNLSTNFFPIFFTLFGLTSIVYFVKLSKLTSIIKISFSELLYLYFIYIPNILYYVLPITIFVAITLTLLRLSNDQELIVINSFGLSPKKISFIILPILLYFSFLLFVISFIVIPKMDNIYDNFKNIKKSEAQFNIKAGVYGQRFGNWLIYVQEKNNKIYKNITLFKSTNKKDTFITSKKAYIKNKNGFLILELYNGSYLQIDKNNINQIDFKKMILNNELTQIRKISTLNDIVDYWLESIKNKIGKRRRFIQNIFIVVLPLISIFLYLGVGYFNPRIQKNRFFLISLLLLIFYMVIMQNLAYVKEFKVLWFIVFWFILGYAVYWIRVKKYY